MNMFSEIILIPAVLLAVSQVEAQTIETLGELNFTCPSGWIIHKANCYLKVDVDESFKEAKDICSREGADLLFLKSEIEYDEVVYNMFPTKNIWMGYTTDVPLDFIQRWGNFEPKRTGTTGCIVVDPVAMRLHVGDCDERHPFACKRRACLQGYVSCDLATKCIPQKRVCDGNIDCTDTSDELYNCPASGYQTINVNGTSSLSTGTLSAGRQKTWRLVAPIGGRIRIYISATTLASNLAFLEIFSVAPNMQETTLIKRFTGSVGGQYIYSTNNFLTVRIYAQNVQLDVSTFNILYTSEIPDIFRGYKDLTAASSWEQLVFPFQDEINKPAMLELRWRITAPVGQVITYYLEKINSSKAMEAHIMSTDGKMSMDGLYVSGTNTVDIILKNVPSNTKLRYKTGCGLTTSRQYGVIFSPKFMGSIPNNIMCSWTLDGGQRVGRGMSVKFYTNFRADPRTTPGIRSEDYITVTADGNTTNVTNYPERIYSSSNGLLVINFTSDAAQNSQDFKIIFATDCPTLNVSNATQKSKTGTVFEEDVQLSCPSGYKFHLEKYSEQRSLTLNCGRDQQWYIGKTKLAAIPDCRVIYCGTPTKIENGYIVKATGAIYNSVAVYKCTEGFTMSDPKNATCDGNGDWVNVPRCISASCPELQPNMLSDGSLRVLAGNNFTSGRADFNTVVQFSCNPGFELLGPVRSRCTNVNWTHVNTPPTCARLPCTVPMLKYGKLDGNTSRPVYGDRLTATCNAGFRLHTGASSLTLTCGANQTFDSVPTCIDINECEESNNCDTGTTLCVNTEGSFTCTCRNGYAAKNGISCYDIPECATNISGCSHLCTETPPGSYSCSCPDGYVLFMKDGDQDFKIPSPETGKMPGDVYRIGHTCVPKKCPSLPALDNGQYLTTKTVFHRGDLVMVHCNDGYFLNGRQSTDATIQCQNNATWTETVSCQARSCDMPTAPSHGSYNVTSVRFMETVTLTCNLTETKRINKSAVCVYISKTAGMRLAGDNLTTCPEIDCGPPTTVLPSGAEITQPSTTTYLASTSKFVFACKPGVSVTGQSESNSTTVVCKANGRWSLGTLSCSGKMCSDPGTPGGMTQNATGYEIGATLSYQCLRSEFEPSGPQNYTCMYEIASDSAVWSGNLASNLPYCLDKQKPVFSCPDYSKSYFFAMDPITFATPNYTDNYGIKHLNFSGSYLRSGDVLSSENDQISMRFTVQDYGGNSATCSYSFNVYDKGVKPSIICPTDRTLTVSNSEGMIVNVSTWVQIFDLPHHNTSLTFSPAIITGIVSKIGSSEEVTATARFTSGPNINAQSQCKFLVNFDAGACFKELLYNDTNAVRDCNATDGIHLFCNSTCRSGYVYGDGVTVKRFTCTGANSWDYNTADPANRFCLPIQSSDDTITAEVVYDFTSNNFNCTTQLASKLAPQLSTFGARLSTECEGLSWGVYNTNTSLQASSQFVATFLLTLQVPNSDTIKKNRCLQTIRSTRSLFNLTDTQLSCSATRNGTLSVHTVTAGGIVVNCKNVSHQKVNSTSLNADVCVPCGQGYYHSSSAGRCQRCPTGQYQDTTGQSQCKQCPAVYNPTTDQTQCQRTCWAGYSSSTGFYPCSVCPVDTYWVNKTHCEACPNGGSTVGVVGATTSSQCYDKCPAGSYSSSGYKNVQCLQCPMNFYQDMTGQTKCKPCGEQLATSGFGAISAANCTSVLACNDTAHCSGHGKCSIQNHRHVCTCDTGYYGATCASMYRICDAKPCTNGGYCVSGAGPDDYTCTCPDAYDVCEIGDGIDDKLGHPDAAVIGGEPQVVSSVDQCKQLCLQNKQCLEASFAPTTGGIKYCSLYNTNVTLVDATAVGSAHFKKICTKGFLGNNCEKDHVDNCASAGCQNNATCVDMVNDFKCYCPSTSITGTLCNVTLNPCASSPCMNGTCKPHGIVRYECTCQDGYTGLRCETDKNACMTTECLHGGTCIDQPNDYVCVCRAGFNGRNCEHAPNFCKAGDCRDRNVCYSSLDKMDGVCACDRKFFNPVYNCSFTWTNNTQTLGTQQSVSPVSVTSVKQCEDHCQSMPKCLYAQHELTADGAMWCSFYDAPNILTQAKPGYTVLQKDCPASGDAYDCHRKSRPCDNSPCKNGATCIDDGFVASCACAAGYTGSLCQHNTDDCANHTCQNGATCVDGNRNYTCECAPGYNGSRCQNNINECPGQCNTSHGACVDRVNGHYCNCSRGYTGMNCETDINECLSFPCKHQGVCMDKVNDYACECPAGWTGKDCSSEMNNCANLSCQNNGVCFNLPNTSFCRCEGGAAGENCENATKVCDVLSNIQVCTNTGNCTNRPGTAECTCPQDYSGVSCQFVKDWCSLTGEAYPCKNGSLCVPDAPRGYMCTCNPGYSGPTCTTLANPCSPNPCGGGATCTHSVTDYICQCPQGKTLSGSQCLGDSPHVIIVNTLYSTSPPVLQSPFRWTPGSLSVMLWVRVHYTEGQPVGSLFSIWMSSGLHPSFIDGMNDYGLTVNTMGIYARSTNWKGIPFTHKFGRNLHDGKWHHLGVAITAEGKMSVTIDAIEYGKEVGVDPLPALTQNGQVSLGYQYLAEYERLTVWNKTLSNMDFALAFANGTEPSTGLIQGWYNYNLKYSAERMSNRLPGNLLDNANLRFPELECGNQNFSHVSTDRIVSRDTFLSIVDDLKAKNNNKSVVFKNSLPASMTWGYYEAIFVGIDSSTKNYGECRTQAFIKYNNACPNPVLDASVTRGKCPNNTDAVCDVTCKQQTITALFAPLPRYMVCSPLGTWSKNKPHENLILPGCINIGDPSYTVTSEMDFAAFINCDNLQIDTKVEDKLQDAFSQLPSKWTEICKRSAGSPNNTCDNLETVVKSCQNGTNIYHVKFAMTFDSQTLTSAGGGDPVLVLDVMRIIILLEKDLDAHFKTIASSVLQSDSVFISLMEVCGTGYTLVEHDTGSRCVPCGAGWMLDFHSKQCIPCDYGYYQPNQAQTECRRCPSNKITYSKGSKSESACVVSCPVGQSYNSGSCSDCPRHYYQDENGQDFCKPCPIGYKTVSAGSNSSTQCKEDCQSGYKRDPTDITKCVQCPQGTYRSTQDDCQACSAGKYTTVNKTAITAVDCDMDNCTLGHYWNTSNSTCTPCLIGEYQDTLYQVQCKRCNDSYSTENTTSTEASACKFYCSTGHELQGNSCVNCQRGYYKDNTGSSRFEACKLCPSQNGANKTTDVTGANNIGLCKVFVCTAGQISTSNGCTKCPADTYQNMSNPFSNTNCTPCPAQGQLSTGTRQIASTMAIQCEVLCQSGYILNADRSGCVPCARGTYKNNDDSLTARFATSCTACSSNVTTETTASTSVGNCSIPKCDAGHYINSSKCIRCPMDTYSNDSHPTAATTCQNCTECAICGPPEGTTTDGANSSAMCMSICGGGKHYSNISKDCEVCPQGQFKPASDRFGQCQKCKDQNYTTVQQGSISDDNCTLRACQPGFKINGANCEPCPLGTYQNASYQNFCYNCSQNTNTNQTGSTSVNDCQIYCGVGLETNQAKSNCTMCPVHKYKAEAGIVPCKSCPTDLTSNPARTACDTVYCAAGRQPNSTNTGCDPCPPHKYKQMAGNTSCQQCPAGVTSLEDGGTVCNDTWCVPGSTLVGSSCQPCGKGTYKEAHGNDACTPCAGSYTTSGNGSNSSTQCDTIICPAGKFRNPSQKTACTACPLNTYQPAVDTTSCFPCESGYITLQEASNSSGDCVPKCNAGQLYNSTRKMCLNCPKGTFKSVIGNYDGGGALIHCLACPENTTTIGERSISTTNCTETVCPMGTYYKFVNSKTQCVACPVGQYSDVKNQPQCTPCPAGNTTFDTGNVYVESCIDVCTVGYGYSSVSRKCEICPTGEYNDNKGSNPNLCKKCPSNFTSTQAGASSCPVPVNAPPKETNIDVAITVVYTIAIDSCNTTDVLISIRIQILDNMKSVFASKNGKTFGQSKGLCRGNSCDNLVLVGVVRCRPLSSGRKRRAINTQLELDFKFENVSSYVTDTTDNTIVTTKDAIAQILVEAAIDKELNPVDGVIEYSSFENLTVLKLCSAGQTKVNDSCEDCTAGTYGTDGKQCLSCGRNTFQNLAGQSSCQPCPVGTINENTNSTSAIDCLPLCNKGFTLSNKQCVPCELGKYKSVEGNTACTICPDGSTTSGSGSTSDTQCDRTGCMPGQFYETVSGQIRCTPCHKGYYSSERMVPQCTQCRANTTTISTGATNASDCITDCPLGYGLNLVTKLCVKCPINQFNNKTGNNPNLCKFCPPAKTNAQSGQNSCPLDSLIPFERKFVNLTTKIKYNVGIENCSSSVALFKPKLEQTLRELFRSQKTSRYRGVYSFCPSQCENIIVEEDKDSCLPRISGRKKRVVTHEYAFFVIFNNVSKQIPDPTDDNVELATSDVVAQILQNSQSSLAPADLVKSRVLEFVSNEGVTAVDICVDGMQWKENTCVPCPLGQYGTSGVCQKCGIDTYQNATGQTLCNDCPRNTFSDIHEAKRPQDCKDFCSVSPLYCNNGGRCVTTERRAATCNCYDTYEGARCAVKKEPQSNLPVILGAAIGGGGSLLVLILVIVGVYRYLSVKGRKDEKSGYAMEGSGGDAFYNAAYYGNPAASLGRIPAIGYPTAGHPMNETGFDYGSQTGGYRWNTVEPRTAWDPYGNEPQTTWE